MQDLVTPPLACHDPILLETVTRGRLHSTRDSQPSWSTGLTCGARSRRSRILTKQEERIWPRLGVRHAARTGRDPHPGRRDGRCAHRTTGRRRRVHPRGRARLSRPVLPDGSHRAVLHFKQSASAMKVVEIPLPESASSRRCRPRPTLRGMSRGCPSLSRATSTASGQSHNAIE